MPPEKSLEPPWKKQIAPRHRRQEADIAKRGGSTHPGSGRIWRFRRDGKLHDFIIEARTTENDSYSISGKEWDTIQKEAAMTPPGCMAMMQLDIQDRRLAVVDYDILTDLLTLLVSLMGATGRDSDA